LHKDFPILSLDAHLRREHAADYRLFYFTFIYYTPVLIFSLFLLSSQMRKYKAGLTIHSERTRDSFLLYVIFVSLQPHSKKGWCYIQAYMNNINYRQAETQQ